MAITKRAVMQNEEQAAKKLEDRERQVRLPTSFLDFLQILARKAKLRCVDFIRIRLTSGYFEDIDQSNNHILHPIHGNDVEGIPIPNQYAEKRHDVGSNQRQGR